jgi:peptide/nickel transport system substrate-binding protein
VPTTDAYVVVSETESERILERNPYYPFVDTEGNQLPYIDRIIIRFAAQRDNVELQAISGGSDILVNAARTSRIPVYLDNEEEGDYTTYIYQDAAFSKPFYVINLTPPEESARYAPYYQDVNFRRAMSLAINREQVNERFYFGRAIPMQATISPNDEAFKVEYATAYMQYDPDRARELLDEVGLEDVDGDGLREFPNGDDFVVKLMYSQALYLSAVELHEYVITNWADVGIKVEMQTVGGGTFWERSGGGQWDVKMHLLDFSMPYPMGFVMWSTPHEHPSTSPWGEFATWFRTDGEDGQRPPDELFDEASKLYDAASEFLRTLDEDALRTILESQAENLWLIGTVGFPPKPVLVANRIKNVPENLLWDAVLGAELQMMPQQWWIDE